MSKDLKISIITVCYNSAATITDTIESVLAQTYPNIEYIIIDGASKDKTLDIILSYQNKIQKIITEPDHGIYDAMNKGIMLSTGDVIGFINADDFYPGPDIIEQVVLAFKQSMVDAVYGDLCYVKSNDPKVVVRYWRSSLFKLGSFGRGWCPPHPTFFVRRHIYEKHGLFDLNITIAADVELMMRFLEIHNISVQYLSIVLVIMRLGGTTNRSLGNIIRQNTEVLRALDSHGLRYSWWKFILNKVWVRGKQFFVRPVSKRVELV